ncbi:MAG: hypothetical protein WB696_02905 [Chthoniobacterales bacterium]
MKFSLVVLAWIALSSCFGIAFGYSPLGLTPLTSMISLSGGFILAVAGVLLQRKPFFTPFEKVQITGVICALIFLAFAARVFLPLIWTEDGAIKVLSPNNLGDICLHLAHINFLASNPHFWPENPIYAFDKLRYPIGINLFNAELKLVGIEPRPGIIIIALLCSVLTLRALFLFGGPFIVAAFLFNGGLAGLQFFHNWELQDFQAKLPWASIPLALFVTQRGLLYAIPAGLLLLTHWRGLFSDRPEAVRLPGWGEWLLYATMPLFHLHTFIFLSFLLLWWFLFGNPNWRLHLVKLVALSIIPATFLVYCVTGFGKTSALAWQPGWMNPPDQSPWWFWFNNFGFVLPLSLFLLVYLCIPERSDVYHRKIPLRRLFFPAAIAFVACGLIRFAPWAWDNTKLFFWAYLLLMYCIWEAFLRRWHPLIRLPIFVALFLSGFISLVGGLVPGQGNGYDIGDQAEWNGVAEQLKDFPPKTVFATYPTYNHPVLVNGHRVVLGYEGHLWSHGLDYQPYLQLLNKAMLGESGWEDAFRQLHADYLFWGNFEGQNYPGTTRAWEHLPVVGESPWGRIYDLRGLR